MEIHRVCVFHSPLRPKGIFQGNRSGNDPTHRNQTHKVSLHFSVCLQRSHGDDPKFRAGCCRLQKFSLLQTTGNQNTAQILPENSGYEHLYWLGRKHSCYLLSRCLESQKMTSRAILTSKHFKKGIRQEGTCKLILKNVASAQHHHRGYLSYSS